MNLPNVLASLLGLTALLAGVTFAIWFVLMLNSAWLHLLLDQARNTWRIRIMMQDQIRLQIQQQTS